MNSYNKDFSSRIDEIAQKWDISGGYAVLKNGEILHKNIYGYADRDFGIPTTKDCTYSFHTHSQLLIGICLMQLIDDKRIKLTDKLSCYIPEYKHGNRITIKNLVKYNSGIPDFFYGKLMIDLNESKEHMDLPVAERIYVETKTLYTHRTFKQVLSLIGEQELDFEPGTNEDRSETNWIFLGEIIKRITGMSLYEYEKKHIFNPLNMDSTIEGYHANTVSYVSYRSKELIRVPVDYNVEGVFTTNFNDLCKLLNGLTEGKLLSGKAWKAMLKYDSEGNGICIENSNGIACSQIEFIGYGFMVYFNQESGLCYGNLQNEELLLSNEGGIWNFFRKEAREEIEGLFTYPMDTKMIRINKKNIWNALNIKVEPEQIEYVLEAKSSIAMCLAYKNYQAFAEMEGDRVVGLLVLDINKKKDHYYISIVQIDRRYQGRGYGKIMMEWAVEYLKKQGAKELEIGVSRFNIAAQKLYQSVGFDIKSVYEDGITMHAVL
ncbi:GNAT family N-acetyltransferase [Anaerocolumna aminovalerica]|uniref:GNAT family N-acetyltransferase n=1 Tax=Anaerocolumna aminovalerica TaxID=1527 RepID=UPI000BE358CB|nr:GNAT family N-acetyltransferase [Anaerocolumna aminovalerica]